MVLWSQKSVCGFSQEILQQQALCGCSPFTPSPNTASSQEADLQDLKSKVIVVIMLVATIVIYMTFRLSRVTAMLWSGMPYGQESLAAVVSLGPGAYAVETEPCISTQLQPPLATSYSAHST